MVALTMAKRKKRMGRPPVPEPRLSIASFRGKQAFAEWFEGLLRHERIPASSLIEKALIAYAEQVGYEPEPPER